MIFLVGFAYSGVIAYLGAFAATHEAPWAVGAYFALYAVVALLGRLFGGRVQDRYGDNVMVFPLLASFAASLVLLAIAQDGVMITVAGLFMGLGFGMLLPTMQAAATKRVTGAAINTAVAAVFLSLDLGVGSGPLVLGLIVTALDYRSMYVVLAVVIIVATVIYACSHGRGEGRAPAASP